MAPTDHLHAREKMPVSRSPQSTAPRRCRRLQRFVVIKSLERAAAARSSAYNLRALYLEMRQDLEESEQRNACARVRIRLLLRDAERHDRAFASARRRIRVLLKDAERRDNEFACARHRIKLLLNDTERRNREYANARRRVRLLLRDAERRDHETPLTGLNCAL